MAGGIWVRCPCKVEEWVARLDDGLDAPAAAEEIRDAAAGARDRAEAITDGMLRGLLGPDRHIVTPSTGDH